MSGRVGRKRRQITARVGLSCPLSHVSGSAEWNVMETVLKHSVADAGMKEACISQ
jgi:hypothetical protein